MVLFIGGNKKPAILRFIGLAFHPFPDGKLLPSRTVNALQVAQRFNVVCQNAPDRDGCLLNFPSTSVEAGVPAEGKARN